MDKPTKTAEELSDMVAADVTRRVGPTTLKRRFLLPSCSSAREA